MISAIQEIAIDLARLPAAKTEAILAQLSSSELECLLHTWSAWARPEQLKPAGRWRTWGILAGRGFGKSRSGSEACQDEAESGRSGRMALVAPTAADARDVMVEGESGILAIAPRWFRPTYEPSKRKLTWPNGALAYLYSAEEPDRLRGPQHDFGWLDEFAAWDNLEATLDNFLMGLRLGSYPRWIFTTTPRPLPILRRLVKAAAAPTPTVVLTRGRTHDNLANLPASFLEDVISKYEGTELGRQEIEGILLDDRVGALFNGKWIKHGLRPKNFRTIVVAVDPAISTNKDSDETGIIVAGIAEDDLAYVLSDRSGKYSPDEWAREVLRLFTMYEADHVVVEVNRGGDLVAHAIRTACEKAKLAPASVPIVEVSASRGKATRAEPIAALYEQGRVVHVGEFELLEKQMIEWDPSRSASPDRIDALVWALTDLLLGAPNADYESLRGRSRERTTSLPSREEWLDEPIFDDDDDDVTRRGRFA